LEADKLGDNTTIAKVKKGYQFVFQSGQGFFLKVFLGKTFVEKGSGGLISDQGKEWDGKYLLGEVSIRALATRPFGYSVCQFLIRTYGWLFEQHV